MYYLRVSILVTIFIIFSCKEKVSENTSNTELYEFIIYAKSAFIDKEKINWEDFERIVLEKAKISNDSAIIQGLSLLNNKHTSYIKNDGTILKIITDNKNNRKDNCDLKTKSIDLFKSIENISYLHIPRFGRDAKYSAKEFIDDKLNIIKSNIYSDFWIIDLRDNLGGSNWVMISSLLPFYKEGIIGYTSMADYRIPWIKKEGSIFNGDSNLTNRFYKDAILLNVDPEHIYVLINRKTISAGEATTISLKSLKNVTILGEKSGGFATMNAEFELSNEDKFYLTSGYMMDINGNIFKNGIQPDYEFCTEDEIANFIKNDIKLKKKNPNKFH